MRRNRLYTVNRWNKQAFIPEENIFLLGGKPVQTGIAPLSTATTGTTGGLFKGLSGALGAGKLSAGAGAGIGALGSVAGGVARKFIGNGFQTGVGNAIGDIGGTVGAAIGMVNPVLGAIVSAGSGILSGVTNAAFGMKTDEQKLGEAKTAIDDLTSYDYANNLDSIMGHRSYDTSPDIFKGGWFKKASASRKNALWNGMLMDATDYADRSIGNNISNLTKDQIQNELANLTAFGGALDIMQQDRYFDTIDKRSDAIAGKGTSMQTGFTGSAKTFADGGLKAAFLDGFKEDPIGAAMRYKQGLEQRAAQEEAKQIEAAREAEYADMQKRLASLETQNQGLQALMGASPRVNPANVSLGYLPEIMQEAHVSSSIPSKATPRVSSGNGTWDYIENQLRGSGKFNDVQIEGIKYNLQRESSINPDIVGDGGAAFGLGQWHGSRKPKDMSLAGQTQHLIDTISSFDGKKHWINKKDYEGFLNARTPEEAHYYLAKGYERPRADIVAKVKRYSDMSLRNLNAFGGELGTNGTDFTNGLLYIDEGGSHEENPMNGVPLGLDPQGIPNLVEEGETVYNNYVFSDRMKVPGFMYKELGLGGVVKKKGKEMSFADASKKLAQESEHRPNDPISQAGLDASLARLAEVQEAERAKKNMKEYVGLEHSCGGSMKKYGLGGNLYGYGSALEWINAKHPNLSEHQKRQIASVMQKRIDKRYPGGRKDINYDTFYSGLAPFFGTEKNLEKSYKALVEDGMSPNTALNVLARATSGSSGSIKDKDKWLERYKAWNPETKKTTVPQQIGQAVTAQSTPASIASVGTAPVVNNPNVVNRGRTQEGIPSNMRFGKGIISGDPIADAIAFNPQEEEVRTAMGLGNPTEITRDEAFRRAAAGEYTSPDESLLAVTTPPSEGNGQQPVYDPYPTWMMYAPAIGAGVMSLTDTLGLTNKPDYTYADRLETAARTAGYSPNISYKPIGDYMRYSPFDRQFHTNQLLGSARATDRALINSSSPSKAAGLLASGYNTTLSLGNLARQAEEYNRAQYERVKDFNRKTNMFNSQMGLEADMANARYTQAAKQLGLSGLGQAAALRDSIDQRVGASRSANITNFLSSLGDIGRQNFAMNIINDDDAYQYGITGNGTTPFKRTAPGMKKSRWGFK